MSQPTQQYPPPPPPRTHSPYPSAASSTGSLVGAPAVKRPRLSPTGQASPYNSPNMNNLSLPNQVFSSPYMGSQVNGTHHPPQYNPNQHFPTTNTSFNHSSTFNSLNTPAPPPAHSPGPTMMNNTAANAMGPPDRPGNRPTDLNDLGDAVVASGVDLREEEALLLGPRQNNNNTAIQHLSLEDQLREASGGGGGGGGGANYPFARDSLYSQNAPGGRNSFYGAGSFNQPPKNEQTPEEKVEVEQRKAVRKQAEIKQYHLNNPFLLGNNLERRIFHQAEKQHVLLPSKGDITRPHQPLVIPQQVRTHGPDGHEVLKVLKGEPLITLKNSMVDILSLVSLATEERLRTFVEDAATLAKGRRAGAHGLVPFEMTDLAAKQPNGEAATGLPTPENSAVSPKENPLKRSYSEANQLPTPVASQTPSPINPIAAALNKLARADREAEEARLVKRRKRQEAAEARDGANSISVDSMPGTPGEVAPEPILKKSALKKDLRKAGPTEEQARQQTNDTVKMAMGGYGKKLSWLTGGKKAEPSNPLLEHRKKEEAARKAAKQGAAVEGPAAGISGNAGGVTSRVVAKTKSWGDFREDGEAGRGIQLRDIIAVMEGDGKEKKALQKAYMRLNGLKVKEPPRPSGQ